MKQTFTLSRSIPQRNSTSVFHPAEVQQTLAQTMIPICREALTFIYLTFLHFFLFFLPQTCLWASMAQPVPCLHPGKTPPGAFPAPGPLSVLLLCVELLLCTISHHGHHKRKKRKGKMWLCPREQDLSLTAWDVAGHSFKSVPYAHPSKAYSQSRPLLPTSGWIQVCAMAFFFFFAVPLLTMFGQYLFVWVFEEGLLFMWIWVFIM